jgi:hypothetical protein
LTISAPETPRAACFASRSTNNITLGVQSDYNFLDRASGGLRMKRLNIRSAPLSSNGHLSVDHIS